MEGLFTPFVETVNMVNAPLIAKQRDIAVTETRNESCADHHTLITLTVTTEAGVHAVAGTLFGGDKPRVVSIKNISVEAELGPHMLYVTNNDKPASSVAWAPCWAKQG